MKSGKLNRQHMYKVHTYSVSNTDTYFSFIENVCIWREMGLPSESIYGESFVSAFGQRHTRKRSIQDSKVELVTSETERSWCYVENVENSSRLDTSRRSRLDRFLTRKTMKK